MNKTTMLLDGVTDRASCNVPDAGRSWSQSRLIVCSLSVLMPFICNLPGAMACAKSEFTPTPIIQQDKRKYVERKVGWARSGIVAVRSSIMLLAISVCQMVRSLRDYTRVVGLHFDSSHASPFMRPCI